MTSHRLFPALLHNELEKIWAHRGKALIIAFIIIVFGGSFIAYKNYHGMQQSYQSSVSFAKTQVIQDQHQLAHLQGSQRRAMQVQLRAARSILKQAERNSFFSTNVAQQIASFQKSLKSTPARFQGVTREQLAMDHYRIHHGITQYHPSARGGYRLVGQVFAGSTMVLLALIALGISADRVSSEMESGTWGGLLLHAPRRRPVYLAKLAASLIATWSFMAAVAVGFFVTAGLLLGFGNPNNPHVVGIKLVVASQSSGTSVLTPVQPFHLIPQWSYDLLALGLAMLSIGALVCIFIALSMVTRSTVFSLIVGAILILSGVLARVAGSVSVIDPAVHLPLMADWTRLLAMQYNVAAWSLKTGLIVILGWAALSIGFSVWYARKLDL